MSPTELLQVSVLFIFSILSFVGLGKRIIGKRDEQVEHYGAYLAVGIITYGYGALILGLLHQFTQLNMAILLLASFVAGATTFKIPKFKLKIDWFSGVILLLASTMLFTTYLMAMQPPHTSDELNYHFPQAQEIVKEQRVDLRFGGHYFYGNIPKQMEVLFAAGISLSGYSYAHTLHFMFLIALLLTVWGIFYKQFGARTASLAVLFLLMYDDLTWNVTSGFVDGAAFCLESMGLLFALKYLSNKEEKHDLIIAGLLIGAGLTIKYSVAVTALFIFLLLLSRIQKAAYFVLPAIIIGGFWYLKNLVWFGNPFYPMYLGHRGVGINEYVELMAAIQQFGPKTLSYFQHLMDYFKEIPRLPIYIALLIAPLAMLVKKSSQFTRMLLVYFIIYVPYWFYLGTHQIRFFAPAVIAALLLTSIVIGQIRAKWIIVGTLLLTLWMIRTPYFNQTVFSFFTSTKLHLTERQYALGNLSRDEFMHRWYGCYYDSVMYLNNLNSPGVVADNWSLGIEFNIPFYSNQNQFRATHDLNSKYMFVRESTKSQYAARFKDGVKLNQDFEDKYIENAEIIQTIDDCQIYGLK